MKNENLLERHLHSTMYVHWFSKLWVVIDFLRKSFSPPSSPLSFCLCFLLSSCFCLVKIIFPVLYPLCWRWELRYYTCIYNCSILVFLLPFHLISGTFLCCQVAKHFRQVQQVSHILNEHPYDGVAVSIFLDLDTASPGTTANLNIPVQS